MQEAQRSVCQPACSRKAESTLGLARETAPVREGVEAKTESRNMITWMFVQAFKENTCMQTISAWRKGREAPLFPPLPPLWKLFAPSEPVQYTGQKELGWPWAWAKGGTVPSLASLSFGGYRATQPSVVSFLLAAQLACHCVIRDMLRGHRFCSKARDSHRAEPSDYVAQRCRQGAALLSAAQGRSFFFFQRFPDSNAEAEN